MLPDVEAAGGNAWMRLSVQQLFKLTDINLKWGVLMVMILAAGNHRVSI